MKLIRNVIIVMLIVLVVFMFAGKLDGYALSAIRGDATADFTATFEHNSGLLMLAEDVTFNSSEPIWTCGLDGIIDPSKDTHRLSYSIDELSDSRHNECLETEIHYRNQVFNLKPHETLKIDDYLEVFYEPSGVITFDARDPSEFKTINGLRGKYFFKFYNKDFITPSFGDTKSLIELGETRVIKLNIDNRFGKNIGGGVNSFVDNSLFISQDETYDTFDTFDYSDSINIVLTGDTLGRRVITYSPFIEIEVQNIYGQVVKKRFVALDKIQRAYFVVPEGSDLGGEFIDESGQVQDEETYAESTTVTIGVQEQKLGFFAKIWNWIKGLFGGLFK